MIPASSGVRAARVGGRSVLLRALAVATARTVACAVLCAVLLAPATTRAQGARTLGPPWRGDRPTTTPSVPSAIAPSPTPSPTVPLAPSIDPSALVQDIHPADATRRYGDGHEGDVSWSDPALDLRPTGYVHAGLFAIAGLLAGTTHTHVAPDLALGALLDFALEPHLSLHLRTGCLFRGRLGGGVIGADEMLGEAAWLSIRGFALLGAHFFQALALRAGVEVGGSAATLRGQMAWGPGWAAVLQIGIRFAGGNIEIVVDGAMDAHELVYARPDGSNARFTDQPSPRLSLGIVGEFE